MEIIIVWCVVVEEKKVNTSDRDYDHIAAWVAIFIFFIIVGVFTFVET